MTMPGKRLGLIAARKAAGLSQERLAEQRECRTPDGAAVGGGPEHAPAMAPPGAGHDPGHLT
jgi:hypothetical protein